MLNRNTNYQEWLLPYLEGGLDEARRTQLEARLAVDPALAAEARQLARTLGGLRGVVARAPLPENAQVPADLWPHLRARLVLDPAPRPRPRAWWLAGVGAPAAAALLVAAFWLPNRHLLTPPTLPPRQTAVPRPVAAPKAVVPTPATPVTPEPAGPPPTMIAPAWPAKPVPVAPAPMAKVGAAKPGTEPLNVPAAAPPVSPFDLPVPAPRAAQDASRASKPQTIPAPPVTGAAQPPVATPPPALAPILPPAPPKPSPATPVVATPPGRAAPSPDVIAPAVTAGAAGVAAGLVPKEVKNGLAGDAARRAKTQANVMHFAAPPAPADAPPAFAPVAPGGPDLGAGGLDSWQAALSAAVRAPLWGENEGDAQANQALTSAREAGLLDDLRARLEARRAQSPRDVVTGRMLAAVYASGFSKEAALRERRRVAGLEGADGEDWYALAQAEERAGDRQAARAAYHRALESPTPPSPFHAAIARGK